MREPGRLCLLAVLLLAALTATPSAIAGEKPVSELAASRIPQQEASEIVEGWPGLIDTLRSLPSRMLAMLPPEMRADPQVRQDVGRLALASLSASALDTLTADGDHPFFLPQLNMLTFGGQPNPDTIYRYTYITPGGIYRIRGRQGSMRIASIGEMPPYRMVNGVLTASPIKHYHDINALRVDDEGRFDVLLSPERPAGYTGDWWPLDRETNRLLLRLVSADWAREQEPTLAIERVDAPTGYRRLPAGEFEKRLDTLAASTAFLATIFVDKVERLRGEGYVNRLKVFDVSAMGGLSGQSYYEGPFELEDDEALIVSAEAPGRCLYRSMMVTNETYDTIDWYNNQSSLNDAQSKVDSDGVLRIVVSATDPGVPNWLDTAGHRRGLIQGRWMDCDANPLPSVIKVKVAEVRKHVPADTPVVTAQERDRIVRDRRAAVQQRRLW